jgi:hypothetical protein
MAYILLFITSSAETMMVGVSGGEGDSAFFLLLLGGGLRSVKKSLVLTPSQVAYRGI